MQRSAGNHSHLNADISQLISKHAHWLLLLVIMVATASRMFSLTGSSLWADELWGVDACSVESWWAMVKEMIFKDSHPPGYQTLLYFSMQWFGKSDFIIRFPSVIAGIVAVQALYAFAARYWSPLIGIIAATLLAVSHNAIYYSQEARAYIFILLFAIWHWHLLFRLVIDQEKNRWLWIGFWLVGALLCYFHYVGVVFVFTEALGLLVLPLLRQPFSVVLKLFLPIGFLYLPWIPVVWNQMLHPQATWVTAAPDWVVMVRTFRFVWGPANVLLYPMCALFIGYLLTIFWRYKARLLSIADQRLLLLVALGLLPWLLFLVKSYVSESAYTVRHFIYFIPVSVLVIAHSLAAIIHFLMPRCSVRLFFVLLAALIWAVMFVNVSDTVAKGKRLYSGISHQEYREAVAVIASDKDFMKNEQRHIFVASGFFNHYLKRQQVRYKPAPIMHADEPEKITDYRNKISERKLSDFYYMEVYLDKFLEAKAPSPILQELFKVYHGVCITRFRWVQVVKFTTQLPANTGATLPGCPHSVAVPLSPVVSALPAENVVPVLPVAL